MKQAESLRILLLYYYKGPTTTPKEYFVNFANKSNKNTVRV